jgi:hypothetical protein
MKLRISESYDYRLYGIPYRDRKRLESLGYEMDVTAVAHEADIGDIIELYDIVTNEKATYTKREDVNGKWILVYKSGYIDYLGKSNLYVYGSFPNGIVAKII